jgi:hypothetical protein
MCDSDVVLVAASATSEPAAIREPALPAGVGTLAKFCSRRLSVKLIYLYDSKPKLALTTDTPSIQRQHFEECHRLTMGRPGVKSALRRAMNWRCDLIADARARSRLPGP